MAEAVDVSQVQAGDEEIRFQASSQPVRLRCDPRRVQQVAVNLLTNAVRYGSSQRGVDVRVRSEGQEALLEVQDYGAGIPEEQQPRIFARFYQAPGGTAGGLGLGLYICREIVEAHHGKIELESRQGHGTLFRVRLPIA